MTHAANAPTAPSTLATGIERIRSLFQGIPYWLIALTARLALAQVFWSSAQTHLASWDTTLYMFSNMYHVPLLPPILAAYITIVVEVTTPWLFVLGLFTRLAALVTFGMTLVIEIFVFPQAWPTHIQWAAMMLTLMGLGAGNLSLDALLRRWIARR
jgi:putative oxidoreductase